MTSANPTSLFLPYDTGALKLSNRVVMASMTRGRACNTAMAPGALHVEYYRQRATAGLIITEGTWVSRRGVGFINVPGLFRAEQVEGWRAVTDAVHGAGGLIFAQLAHSGAVSHPDFFDGDLPWAPSAINPGQRTFTPSGFKETLTPRPMTIEDIRTTVAEYALAARHARDAGFDGVEIHAATTYLLPQFLHSDLNTRRDAYGGSAVNRIRIVLEILEAALGEWGAGRVGIKLSPTLTMGSLTPNQDTVATYNELIDRLDELPLSHLQIVRANRDLTGSPVEALQDTIGYYRQRYRGTLMANGGFDGLSGSAIVASGNADLVSFATPFIGNPDLVRRLREDLPLAGSHRETYYQGGAEGYIDYAAALETPEKIYLD
ncbi:alkene reductase [Dyella kyungheensis]|uniref:Alkene reductase n=1 Tax=Dyella kyungheensis TaxID=1242174 RepID=A0ABS2JWK4_9GAMM|nr:alkene reductase [Dyella kyungheensis]MBM7122974.1 alkene reductase [Dyella kyungheensis]